MVVERLTWILLMGGLVAYLHENTPNAVAAVKSPSAQNEVDPTRYRGTENEWPKTPMTDWSITQLRDKLNVTTNDGMQDHIEAIIVHKLGYTEDAERAMEFEHFDDVARHGSMVA